MRRIFNVLIDIITVLLILSGCGSIALVLSFFYNYPKLDTSLLFTGIFFIIAALFSIFKGDMMKLKTPKESSRKKIQNKDQATSPAISYDLDTFIVDNMINKTSIMEKPLDQVLNKFIEDNYLHESEKNSRATIKYAKLKLEIMNKSEIISEILNCKFSRNAPEKHEQNTPEFTYFFEIACYKKILIDTIRCDESSTSGKAGDL
jgi:hypothetical protein